jgi:hypothetical protein
MSSASKPADVPPSATVAEAGPADSQAIREKAAGTIQVFQSIILGMSHTTELTIYQRTYRGHKTRRELQGLGLDSSTRWREV